MQVTAAGYELIKKWEGCRLTAYKDAVGVLTIGYGHTSMAGPPLVKPGMKITKKQAHEILVTDVGKFALGVDRLITNRRISNAQFSACVSLAFNVGLGNFKKSSVLRFINQNKLQNAADAFLLWNKAGGRVLPGLVKRRAEEAAMFSRGGADDEVEAMEEASPEITVPEGKNPLTSTTNVATGLTTIAGVTAAGKEVAQNTNDLFSMANLPWFLLIAVILGAGFWLFMKRHQLAKNWDL